MARAASAINQAVGTAETETGGGGLLAPPINQVSIRRDSRSTGGPRNGFDAVRQSGAAAKP